MPSLQDSSAAVSATSLSVSSDRSRSGPAGGESRGKDSRERERERERDLRPGSEAAEPSWLRQLRVRSNATLTALQAKCLKSNCYCAWFFCHSSCVKLWNLESWMLQSRRRIQKGLKVWNKCYLGDSDLHNCCQSFHPSLSCIQYFFYASRTSFHFTFINRLWRGKLILTNLWLLWYHSLRERASCAMWNKIQYFISEHGFVARCTVRTPRRPFYFAKTRIYQGQ